MLRVSEVSLGFGGIVALREVSFDVDENSRLGLIGPNGAGKTALLNCACGVYRPSSGGIFLGDSRLDLLPMERISRMGVARTFQSMDHFEEFTVSDYVLLGRVRYLSGSSMLAAFRWPSAIRREREQRRVVDEVLERCGLNGYREAVLSEVPYGTQKLVDIARVLCSEARWALLDEPTSGTTSEERPAISAALKLLADEGTSTIVVDHDIDFVAEHADRIVALDQGSVISVGDTAAVLADQVVRRIYRGLVREEQIDRAQSRPG